jgi:hypothetical protein
MQDLEDGTKSVFLICESPMTTLLNMKGGIFFVVETGAYEDGNPRRLLDAARARGFETRAVEFSDGTDAGLAPVDVPVVAYGSLGMVRGMMRQNRWRPVAWLDPVALSCRGYYPKLEELLLQRNYLFVEWGALPGRLDELIAGVGKDGAVFIRPDDCWKTFAGRRVRGEDFARWHKQNSACFDIPADTYCVVATPQDVLREWRCVVAGGSVVASSAYVGEGRVASNDQIPREILDLAVKAAASGAFDSMAIFTIDVGQTREGVVCAGAGNCECFKFVSL